MNEFMRKIKGSKWFLKKWKNLKEIKKKVTRTKKRSEWNSKE